MGDIEQTIDALQGKALDDAIKKIDRIYEIVVGNGNPEKGLTAKVMLLQRDVEDIKQKQISVELTRATQITEIKTMIEQDRTALKSSQDKSGDRWYDMGSSMIKALIAALLGALITLLLSGRIHIT